MRFFVLRNQRIRTVNSLALDMDLHADVKIYSSRTRTRELALPNIAVSLSAVGVFH